ncbi:MAG: hypothetical protein JWN04_174 [Myxococcaceae bacterium]|nr:hypothetical protein [Myxococcaceae bacterium]
MLGLSRDFMSGASALLSLFLLACSADPTGQDGTPEEPSDGGTTHSDGGASTRETALQCADGLDNDHNGKIDCADPSCKVAQNCGSSAGRGDAGTSIAGDASDACSTIHGDGLARKLPVDIVWVIDDSLSMLDDITRIQQNMATFADSLIQAGLDDYHIVVLNEPSLTLGAPWDANTLKLDATRFFPVSVVAWNDCFTPVLASFSMWSADIRPEAALHFIMVTDDNSLMQWPDFKMQMDTLLGGRKFTVHALVDPPQHCLGSTQPGTVYWEAAMATGGQQRSICEADWLPTFTAIESSIQTTAVIPCEYDIPVPSDGQTYNRSDVNVQHVLDGTATRFKRKLKLEDCGSETGWYYDDVLAPTQVLLCPAACALTDQQGGSVDIEFVCDPDQIYL